MMRDAMKTGDFVLFYHSNTKPPHVAGIARVVRDGYPDFTSWDSDGKYFDEKSTPENPRWFMVDIEPVMELPMVSLHEMKENPNLEGMPLLQRGQRLSVQSVSQEHFDEILRMGNTERSEFE
jgi:predicted RNA-binding protein with PUA-like domain